VRVRDELRLIPIENVLCFIAEQKYTAGHGNLAVSRRLVTEVARRLRR
jgi:hypothetical protein